MAKLFTHHDPGHVHKTLGFFCLFHFFYRFVLATIYFDAFPFSADVSVFDLSSATLRASGDADPVLKSRCRHLLFDLLCITLHGVLSWSSLLLPVPKERNFSAPMIWQEFRAHSILFASRHIVMALLVKAFGMPSLISAAVARSSEGQVVLPQLLTLFTGTAVVIATSLAAQWYTDNYGCREKRTTNTMPYPAHVGQRTQELVKVWYMTRQFDASLLTLFGCPTANFLSILPIQLAAFLMTLVRKGWIRTIDYHRVYTWALFQVMVSIMFQTLMAGDFGVFGSRIFPLVDIFVTSRNYVTKPWHGWVITALAGAIMILTRLDLLIAAVMDWNLVIVPTLVWTMLITFLKVGALFMEKEADWFVTLRNKIVAEEKFGQAHIPMYVKKGIYAVMGWKEKEEAAQEEQTEKEKDAKAGEDEDAEETKDVKYELRLRKQSGNETDVCSTADVSPASVSAGES